MANQEVQRKLRNIVRNIKRLPQAMSAAMQGKTARLAVKALKRLQTEPGRPIYPIRWTSERQRRAFFATDGFGGGIPTTRTGGIIEDWQVEYVELPDGGIIRLTNPNPGMPYLQGAQAQQFHIDTGWVQVVDVKQDFYQEVSDEVVVTWEEVTAEVVT